MPRFNTKNTKLIGSPSNINLNNWSSVKEQITDAIMDPLEVPDMILGNNLASCKALKIPR